MKWKINILIGSLLVFVGILLGTMLTRRTQIEPPLPEMEIVRDTITEVFIDTHTVYKPTPYKVTVVDTVYVDSFQSGTDWKVLVQEIKEYGDSTYYARVSGINVFLEEWRTYPKTVTKYITTTETIYQKPKKWGLLAGIEYEPIPQNNVKLFGEIEYRDNKNIFSLQGGNELISKKWYVQTSYKRVILNK